MHEEPETRSSRNSAAPPDAGKQAWFSPAFFLLLGVITLVAYRSVIDNTLLCDDYYLLGRDRLHVFGGGGLGDLSSLRWIFYAEYPLQLRPVVLAAWLLLSRFFGAEPWPTHLMNIMLHAANAWLLFWLLTRLKASRVTAALPALLFALTPIAPEAVSWSSGDTDLFPLFFLLLGLGSYAAFLENGKRLWYAVSLAAMAMALLSKEMAMTMIILIPAAELLLGNALRADAVPDELRATRSLKQATARIMPFLALFAGYLALRFIVLGTLVDYGRLPSMGSAFEYSPLFTISVFLSPFNNMYFRFGVIAGAGLYTMLLLAISLMLVARGWSTAERQRRRLWIFLLLGFLVSLVPVSPFLIEGLNLDLSKSHFLYMATAFFLSMLAIGLLEFGRGENKWSRAGVIALMLLLPLYFWGVQTNNRYWEDAAASESVILEEMARIMPEPPENGKIYLLLEGETKEARVYWCEPMLKPAVRSKYDRYDLRVVQMSKSDNLEDAGDTSDGYLFIYNGIDNKLRLDHAPVP